MGSAIVVADTSVIINFLRIDRMDLIGAHPRPFVVTDHVADEITDSYPEQRARFHAALGAGHITQHRVDDPPRWGSSCAFLRKDDLALASALPSQWRCTGDSRWRSTTYVRSDGPSGRQAAGNPVSIVRTQDIVVELIRCEALTVEMADAMLVDWASNHRFTLKISSFQELL